MHGRREYLIHLLTEAAEIEHNLLCSYLYAAFSLKRGGEIERPGSRRSMAGEPPSCAWPSRR